MWGPCVRGYQVQRVWHKQVYKAVGYQSVICVLLQQQVGMQSGASEGNLCTTTVVGGGYQIVICGKKHLIHSLFYPPIHCYASLLLGAYISNCGTFSPHDLIMIFQFQVQKQEISRVRMMCRRPNLNPQHLSYLYHDLKMIACEVK